MDHLQTEADAVRSFLADRDAPCPGCGYNLRGIERATCPECGRAVELTLSREGRGRGYLLFVLLALGWVVCAGGMNSYRTWKEVKSQATPRLPFATFNGSFSITTSGSTTVFKSSGSSPFTMNLDGITTGTNPVTTTRPRNGGPVTITRKPVALQNVITAPATTSPVWGNVTTQAWFQLGWWSGLGIAALAFLLVAIVGRSRFDRERLPWVAIGASVVLFALYAGYHAVMFARELA